MNAKSSFSFRVFLKIVGVSFALLIVCGQVYEQIGEHFDRTRYPRIGTAVDVGGRTLNLYCSGEGSPTVILDSGGHTAGYGWITVEPEVAKFTRVCWYDRAGYGWSDPGPHPRTFVDIAHDLHALLENAHIRPPYVLVGATASAFHVRVFNGLYPTEVAGAVLIQASDPDIFAHEPPFMKGALASLPVPIKAVNCRFLAPAMVHVGLLRLFGNPGAGRPFGLAWLNQDQQRELLFLSNKPETALTEGEGCFLDESMNEVRKSGNFGSRPLIVLVDSNLFPSPGPQFAQATQDLNDYWFHKLQPHLATLSSRGQLVASDQADNPPAIISAIHDVVTDVRSGAQ
ncbi:MAG: alpha/beta fold hydrolase [Terracidiphilus sp.]